MSISRQLMQIVLALMILTSQADAFYDLMSLSHDNYCAEKRSPRMIASRVCPGQVIPAYQSRNFHSEQLTCANTNQTHIRLPEQFDEEAWLDLKNIDRFKAFDLLRSQPSPKWAGELVYQTYLNWTWEECRLVTDSSLCGSHLICYDDRFDPNSSSIGKSCQYYPNTCYADVTVTESTICTDGDGQLDFDVEFIKKNKDQWNPNNKNYIDRLANGYDLLPGEEEAITVSNIKNKWWTSQATALSPNLLIDDPKNEYNITQHIDNKLRHRLTCRFQGYDKVSFKVNTEARIPSHSPNAFTLPKSYDNETIEPIIWQSAKGRDGSRIEKGYPVILRAQDLSASALSEISEDVTEKLKDIVVRIQLYEPSIFGETLRSTIYIDEAKGIQQTLNAISDDQIIRRSTLWELELASGKNPDKNIYRSYVPSLFYYPGKIFLSNEDLSYDDYLTPDTEYTLKLTVYQKNLPIYNQSCENDPNAWDCQWYAMWGLLSPKRYENNYFSKKSLDIKFKTNPNVDQRTWLSTFWQVVRYGQVTVPIGALAFTLLYLA